MQIFKLDQRIRSRLSERDSIMSTLVKATDTSAEQIHTLDIGRPTEDTVIKLMRYNDEVNQETDNLVDLKIQISEEITQLEDDTHRMVLRERYIKCRKWEEIAVDNHIDLRWLYRLHGKALGEFEERFPDKFSSPC